MRPFDIPILIVLAAAAAWFILRRIRAIRAQGNPGASSTEDTRKP
jgi:hypothetical protein